MRAMILAAGRGERMRPLTDSIPKPLLQVGGKPLIAWHLERLAGAGITEVIINHAWLGEQIERELGDGHQYGVDICYSRESPALETAGGIARALEFLDRGPFLVINGDTWCDWNPSEAAKHVKRLTGGPLSAWLLLADNPAHHPAGDFVLDHSGLLHQRAAPDRGPALTFTGIGIYQPSLFRGLDPDLPAPLAPVLNRAISRGSIVGERHTGAWIDVGTPERLAELDATLSV